MFVEVRFSGEGLDINGEVCGSLQLEPLRSISVLGQTGKKQLVDAEAWTGTCTLGALLQFALIVLERHLY